MGARRRLMAILPLAAAGLYGAVSAVFATKLVGPRFPSDEPTDFAAAGLPTPEAVTIHNGAIALDGWFFANPRRAGCAVVLLHGFSTDKSVVVPAAPLFWDRGCDLLTYDLRSHGRSTPDLLTYGVHDSEDESLAVDWLVSRTGLPAGRIGLMGWSYGAATSLLTAARRRDLAFVVADASYSSLVDIATVQAEQRFGRWARLFVPGALAVSAVWGRFDPRRASPVEAVRDLPTPVLVITSTTDGFTPYEHSEAIFAAADPSHTRLVLTRWGAPHAMSYPTDPEAYTRIVDAFLDELVPGFGRREPATAVVAQAAPPAVAAQPSTGPSTSS